LHTTSVPAITRAPGQAGELAGALAAARKELAAAQRHLDALDEQIADRVGQLASVIAAVHDARSGKQRRGITPARAPGLMATNRG